MTTDTERLTAELGKLFDKVRPILAAGLTLTGNAVMTVGEAVAELAEKVTGDRHGR